MASVLRHNARWHVADVLGRAPHASFRHEVLRLRRELADLAVVAALDPAGMVIPAIFHADIERVYAAVSRFDAENASREQIEAARAAWAAREAEAEVSQPVVVDQGQDSAPRLSLAALAGGAIRTIVNGDAGSGSWNLLAGEAFPGAQVVGIELADPVSYGANRVDPVVDWERLAMFTDRAAPGYPTEGKADMVHVAFLHMKEPWQERLRHYMSLARRDGLLVLIHSDAYEQAGVPVRESLRSEVLSSGEWTLIDDLDQSQWPLDLPITEWGRTFSRHGRSFVQVFRRRSPSGPPAPLPPVNAPLGG